MTEKVVYRQTRVTAGWLKSETKLTTGLKRSAHRNFTRYMLTPPPHILLVVVVLSMVSLFVVGKLLKGTFICTCMNIIIRSDSGGTLYSKRLCRPGKDGESGRLVNALAEDAAGRLEK